MMDKVIESVVIVGSGNLAEALANTLRNSPFELRQVFARNKVRGEQVAQIGATTWSNDPTQLATADLYLIAVSDRAIASVASELCPPHGSIVAHTAGCVALDALPFEQRAVLYPLQTFTQGCAVDFTEIPLFIEGSSPSVETSINHFANLLSHTVLSANGEQRAHIHLAGVFANNFTNHLFACASEIVRGAGLPSEILRPLIRETTSKAIAATDPNTVQSGPALRGDTKTQQRHMELLNDKTLETIYQIISKHIWEISKKI